MGMSTTAILRGHVSSEEIADVLADSYGAKEVRVAPTYAPRYKYVHFKEVEKEGRHRTLSVFEESYCLDDRRHVFQGEGTLVSAGCSGDSEKFVGILVKEFGGIFQAADINEDWAAEIIGTRKPFSLFLAELDEDALAKLREKIQISGHTWNDPAETIREAGFWHAWAQRPELTQRLVQLVNDRCAELWLEARREPAMRP
jgi:hypothetical protein